MATNRNAELDVLGPALTAAVFGYFGFIAGLATTGNDGEMVPLYAVFVWSMRVVALGALASVLLALSGSRKTAPLYLAIMALAAASSLGCAAWDLADTTYNLACPPILLIVFAIWNGYCAFGAARELRG
ncbi:MAG: hypothetical protein LW636_06920 [Planctomycetaceae bacterium]|jgi:hypothetical protein|nr:hypothetical protein [Planctomycetaceae bacterium]